MADPPDDEDGADDAWAAATAAQARAADEPPADDYARHLRAEARWQSRRAALRLWAEITRCLARGR